jgi:hypothetical protein
VKLGYLAIDQYGGTLKIDAHPRKELLAHCERSHADKMFVDSLSGQPKHIGYVIGGHWWTVYEIHEWVGSNA